MAGEALLQPDTEEFLMSSYSGGWEWSKLHSPSHVMLILIVESLSTFRLFSSVRDNGSYFYLTEL